MQTVTFKCGHCGSLIGIGLEYLARKVRCPHCQKVVLAQTADAEGTAEQPVASEPVPATVAEAAAVATIEPSPVGQGGETESVDTADQVWGELAQSAPDISAPGDTVPTGTPSSFDSGDLPVALQSGQISVPPAEAAEPASTWTEHRADESLPQRVPIAVSGRIDHRPVRTGVSIWLVIPLVSYSVLATIFLIVLWNRLQSVEVHPLIAFLPDSEGDAPGVVRKPKGVNESRKRRLIGEPLPAQLTMKLGETRTVGALAVTAERVTREQVAVGDGSAAPLKLDGPSLVLHLRLENVSEDETFQPLDRFFDRRWREESSGGAPPLTLLEAGSTRFYGGPAEWRPRDQSARNNKVRPEFIYLMSGEKPVADPVDRPLGPGESAEVFVCTDGSDPRSAGLVNRKGKFLWRVHVRRGLVNVLGRDVPAAAVVGVAFADRDIGG